MNTLLKYITVTSLGLAMISCEPEIDSVPTPEAAGADFSTYVALGNSLTAGFSDNALYREAQTNSYPALLAGQFAEAGGGPFTQPLVPEGNGANGSGAGKLELSLVAGSPFPLPTPGDPAVFNPVTDGRPYNNLGVPGAKAAHLVTPGYGSDQGNPFFARFASSPATTVVSDAVAQNPTFFTLWIGNNDVLGYATSGGEGDQITDKAIFDQAIGAIINSLTQSNPDIGGAIANIPDVTKIPYFNVVAWNAFELGSQEQVNLLTAGFEATIDPLVKDAVDSAVVKEAVTGVVIRTGVVTAAVNTQIIPGVAHQIVKMQIAASPACNGDADPAACAEDFIASGEADADIAALEENLQNNYFLEAEERDPTYKDAYAAIDQALEDPETQAQIEAGFEQTLAAYESGNLPEEQAAQITAAIDENFQPTLDAFEAGLLPPELQEPLTAAADSVFAVQIAQLKAGGFYPEFEIGPNGFVVEVGPDASPTGIKQLTADEKMLLTFLGRSDEEFNPAAGRVIVPDHYALDASELAAIEAARTAFNTTLQQTAQDNGFAYVDIAELLNGVASQPLLIDGKTYSATFVTGNLFSLDGVHLTQAGYAIAANHFIAAINATYASSVPPVSNINQFKTVPLP